MVSNPEGTGKTEQGTWGTHVPSCVVLVDHERVDSRNRIMAGSESIFIEVTEYIFQSNVDPSRI